MGAEKPKPIKLSLRNQDLSKFAITETHFTPAKFNNGDKANETSIVSSTGNWLVTWNLKRAQKGHVNDYKLKPLEDKIVSNEFRYNTDQNLLVTTKQQVQIQKRKKMIK